MDSQTTGTIVITLTIPPVKNGKRQVLLSAAPEGEMPLVLSGPFSQLHTLLDAAWVQLQKRKPQVVKKPKPAPVTIDATQKDNDGRETADEEPQAEEATGASPEQVQAFEAQVSAAADETSQAVEKPDQMVRLEDVDDARESDGEPLPVIENDPTAPTKPAWQQPELPLPS